MNSNVIRRLVVSVVAGLLAVTLADRAAVACSCKSIPSVDEQFKDASVVFVGTAVARDAANEYAYAYTFEVEDAWKGVGRHRIVVLTGKDRRGLRLPLPCRRNLPRLRAPRRIG